MKHKRKTDAVDSQDKLLNNSTDNLVENTTHRVRKMRRERKVGFEADNNSQEIKKNSRENSTEDFLKLSSPEGVIAEDNEEELEPRERKSKWMVKKIWRQMKEKAAEKESKKKHGEHTSGANKKWIQNRVDNQDSTNKTLGNKKEAADFKKKVLKHARGEGVDINNIKHHTFKKRLENKEKKIEFAADQAARSELLLSEEAGYIEAGDYEETTDCTQKEIKDASDITSATKHFELDLQFGPYRLDYTPNGRHLLLGGALGHVAAFDWVTKQLMCEINVMESVHDVKWLHIETMFAVAQKSHLFIYDNQGTELHCIRQLNQLLRLEFLPYHFLLASSSESGRLAWLDVSIGKLVSQFNARMGRLPHMTQNPYNATIALGHPTGVVSLWSPTVREPLAKLLCHKAAIQALHIDPTGRYLASSAINNCVNIWDIRALKPLQSYRMQGVPSTVKLSQRGCMALGTGNVVQVYRDCVLTPADTQYLTYKGSSGRVSDLRFCPFEDVLGAGTERGFCSLIVPGCGEPNFDALEQNPFRTKEQRREGEVKSLLEKIQPELITLEPQDITEVDLPSLHDKLKAKEALMTMKVPKVNYKPRRNNKKGGGLQAAKAKKILQEEARKEFVKTSKKRQAGNQLYTTEEDPADEIPEPKSVLDRFKPKRSKKKTK